MSNWAPPQLPILLLDVDGVLADFVTPMLKAINEVLDRSYTKADLTEHDMEGVLGLTYEERNEVRVHVDRMRMARTLAPLPGAVEGVKRLAKSANIFFNTSRLSSSQTWCWDRSAWLDELLGEGWGKKAQYVKDKYLVQGDIFVDDHPGNVEKWSRFNSWNHGASAVLWNQWYNENHKFDPRDELRIIRSNSWEYLEHLVWEKTTKKDALTAWVERNTDWLYSHSMHWVAVNPYVGTVLISRYSDEVKAEMSGLPSEIRKDMIMFFNSCPAIA